MERILIADDSIDNADMMQTVLSCEGFFTKVLNTGTNLIQEVKEYRPSLVILDIMFGDFDGRVLAKSIRNTVELCNIKLVLISAGFTSDKKEEIQCDCCDAFIAKPFNIDNFVETVKGLVFYDTSEN
ncbi:MAG: response regulator [Flavobacterium sp.]|nr:MAG: response regulator [Flavobacterium sp.]